MFVFSVIASPDLSGRGNLNTAHRTLQQTRRRESRYSLKSMLISVNLGLKILSKESDFVFDYVAEK
jgi:hypothetical protein